MGRGEATLTRAPASRLGMVLSDGGVLAAHSSAAGGAVLLCRCWQANGGRPTFSPATGVQARQLGALRAVGC